MHTEMVYASTVPALIEASKEAWMTVVGSQGIAHWDGSCAPVSTALIQHAHCPVAVIRTDDGTTADPKAPVLVGIDGFRCRKPRRHCPSTKPPAGE